ncbi:D-glycero-alpha-D-manno-heptose-1, 7-bisphosphate 7-phosphatase [uncultured Desulfobacterium sp.]|uniref:D,D-heptose 1,7-bisphosphate phosphatase n=1 Tax=uncultured Desulfobacterium sp. TaxID=201089 RepID=A0A445N489_9BACT|nr:D-glycero-alpha-D-manno-heptose-1, 7-bisphosphate 7-phosphatase [uncultured Desulfobacterium sp.]
MRRPAVFIDRDGTINEQMGYINHLSRFVMFPWSAEAIRSLNRHQYLAIVVSNQSGVARGYYPIDLVEEVHDHMRGLLAKEDAFVDAVFFCPHYPKGNVEEYSIECNCRKPGTGQIEAACNAFDIDMDNSFVVGDRYSDIELAKRSGLKSALVMTGYGLGDINYVFPRLSFRPDHVAKNLLQAVQWVIEQKIEA